MKHHNSTTFTAFASKRKPITSQGHQPSCSWAVVKLKYAYLQLGKSLECGRAANSPEINRSLNLVFLVLCHLSRQWAELFLKHELPTLELSHTFRCVYFTFYPDRIRCGNILEEQKA